MEIIRCERCSEPFHPKNYIQRFCSDSCRRDTYNETYFPEKRNIYLSTQTVGAIGELRVSVDLFEHGWSVFRAMSPSCACDLIAMRGDIIRRVEVKSAYRTPLGTLNFSIRELQKANFDLLALVLPDGTVEYRRGLDEMLPEPR